MCQIDIFFTFILWLVNDLLEPTSTEKTWLEKYVLAKLQVEIDFENLLECDSLNCSDDVHGFSFQFHKRTNSTSPSSKCKRPTVSSSLVVVMYVNV